MESKKSQVINVWIAKIKPEAETQLGSEGAALWYAISKLPGFISYKWFHSINNPLEMVTISEWKTIEDLKRFKKLIEEIYGSKKHEVFQGEPLSFDLIEVGTEEYKAQEYEEWNKEP